MIIANSETTLAKKVIQSSPLPLAAGAVFGAGGAIGEDSLEGALYAGGTAMAVATFGVASTKAIGRIANMKRGKELARSKTDNEYKTIIKEIESTGVDLNRLKKNRLSKDKTFYDTPEARFKDFEALGEADRLLKSKSIAVSRYALDNAENFIRVGAAKSHQLNVMFRKEFPILAKRERSVLEWIQGNKKRIPK